MAQTNSNGVLPPEDLVRAARTFVERTGTHQAAVALKVSRVSLACLVAGLRVRRGTIALVAQGLAQTASPDTVPPPVAA